MAHNLVKTVDNNGYMQTPDEAHCVLYECEMTIASGLNLELCGMATKKY